MSKSNRNMTNRVNRAIKCLDQLVADETRPQRIEHAVMVLWEAESEGMKIEVDLWQRFDALIRRSSLTPKNRDVIGYYVSARTFTINLKWVGMQHPYYKYWMQDLSHRLPKWDPFYVGYPDKPKPEMEEEEAYAEWSRAYERWYRRYDIELSYLAIRWHMDNSPERDPARLPLYRHTLFQFLIENGRWNRGLWELTYDLFLECERRELWDRTWFRECLRYESCGWYR